MSNVLISLARGELDTLAASSDTRPVHEFLFRSLVPPGHEYFAGHYRGEDYRCLQNYAVGVADDDRVGASPPAVWHLMRELGAQIGAAVAALDAHRTLTREDRVERLRYAVVFACRALESFLRIHPYANGNGHAGRFILWAILGRYGHWPKRFPIDPRPAPPFVDFIKAHRDGDPEALEMLVLRSLIP